MSSVGCTGVTMSTVGYVGVTMSTVGTGVTMSTVGYVGVTMSIWLYRCVQHVNYNKLHHVYCWLYRCDHVYCM